MKHAALGFSMLELLITLAIVALIAMVGVPNFQSAISNSRLTASINELVTTFNTARSEAVKRNRSVTVRKTGTNWEEGWIVFVDMNADGALDGAGDSSACASGNDCILKTQEALPNGYSLRPSGTAYNNFVRYTPNGFKNGTAGVTFYLCDTSSSTPKAGTARVLILNAIGRARMGVDDNNNGIPEITSNTDITTCNP